MSIHPRRLVSRIVPAAAAGVVLVMAAAFLAGCGSESPSQASSSPSPAGASAAAATETTQSTEKSLIAGAEAEGLTSFLAAAKAAGLYPALRMGIPYTLIAPSDEAFAAAGLDELLKDVSHLKAVMDYHVVPAENVKLARVKDGYKAMTNAGFPVVLSVSGGAVTADGAAVVRVVEGPTWTIYVLDKVLTPPVLMTSPEPST